MNNIVYSILKTVCLQIIGQNTIKLLKKGMNMRFYNASFPVFIDMGN